MEDTLILDYGSSNAQFEFFRATDTDSLEVKIGNEGFLVAFLVVVARLDLDDALGHPNWVAGRGRI